MVHIFEGERRRAARVVHELLEDLTQRLGIRTIAGPWQITSNEQIWQYGIQQTLGPRSGTLRWIDFPDEYLRRFEKDKPLDPDIRNWLREEVNKALM